MHTEFPGTVYPIETYSNIFYYKFIKLNVEKLNLIISLFNEKREIALIW